MLKGPWSDRCAGRMHSSFPLALKGSVHTASISQPSTSISVGAGGCQQVSSISPDQAVGRNARVVVPQKKDASPCSLGIRSLSWRFRALGWLTPLALHDYWIKYINCLGMGSTLWTLLYLFLALVIGGVYVWDSSPLTADVYVWAEQRWI